MNGRLLPSAGLEATGRSAEESRLLAALLASFLLHLAVLILPLLGERNPEYRLALKGGQKMPYFLNATLVMAGEHRFSAETLQAEGETVPHASVPARADGEQLQPEQPSASGAGLLPTAALAYYTPDQLTKRPQPIAKPDLDPPEIKPIIASGKLVLKLWINDRGRVARVDVESSSLPENFTRTAVAAFQELRFEPGQRDGQAVGSVLKIEVDYEDGRALSGDERGPIGDGRSRSR
jgi:TonB family protein